MKKKVVIIGAGIAGLATAIRLSVKGFEVHIHEANSYPGGKLTEFELDGFRFDAGPSLFTMPQFVEELFTLSGKNMKDFFTYKRKEIVCEYFFDDQTRFTAYADLTKYIEHAREVFNIDPQVLQDYFKSSKKKYDLTSTIFLQSSLHKASTYFSIDTLKAIFAIRSLNLSLPLHAYNQIMLKHPHLVQLFDRYATYNGSSPFLTPGIMSMIPHLEQHYGTYMPDGGMISITNAMVELAKSLGVQIHYNSRVNRIEIAEKSALGVVVNNELIHADRVVSNMDIVPTYRQLLKSEKAPERTLKQERSSSALIFYWGISREFPQLNLHNIFFAKDYENEFKTIFKDKLVADDITVYVNITSKDVKTDAPPRCENWFVMVNVPSNTGQDWPSITHRVRAQVIAKMSKQLNVRFEELIQCEKILDPNGIEFNTQSYQGALYGSASNNQFAAFLRHPNFSNHIKNLYFCGGSVHPGGGIPLCLLSAKITSQLITN